MNTRQLVPYLVIAAAAGLLATGCATSADKSTATATTNATLDAPDPKLQTANAPLQDLLAVGEHCFATGVEAVAAQLRAASADAKADAEDDARQARGELRKKGRDTTVVHDVEDNATCYTVKTDSPFP